MGRRVTCLDALACYRVDDRGMEGRGLRGGCSWTSFATLTAPHLIFCWPWGQHSPLLTVLSVISKIQMKVPLHSRSIFTFIWDYRNGSSEKTLSVLFVSACVIWNEVKRMNEYFTQIFTTQLTRNTKNLTVNIHQRTGYQKFIQSLSIALITTEQNEG